jgi:hypothetical protein
MMTQRNALVLFSVLLVPAALAAQSEPPKVALVLDDQYEHKQDIVRGRGNVIVLLYGDREGMSANKALGEKLHVHFHPSAEGKSSKEASRAPVTPVPGLPEGVRSPDVRIVPVACIGKVPDTVKDFIRGRMKKESPDTLVLLDFENKMKDQYGLKEGEANLLVIDVSGRLRMKVNGALDDATYARVLKAVDLLRKEGAK